MALVNRGRRLLQMDRDSYLELLRSQILRRAIHQDSGCWIWSGSHQVNGYGSTRVLGKNTPAHRAAYLAFVGEIPDGFEICHSCDVRNCVNPAHLSIGTHAENMRDMSARGRGRGGMTTGAYVPIRDSSGRFTNGNGATNVE